MAPLCELQVSLSHHQTVWPPRRCALSSSPSQSCRSQPSPSCSVGPTAGTRAQTIGVNATQRDAPAHATPPAAYLPCKSHVLRGTRLVASVPRRSRVYRQQQVRLCVIRVPQRTACGLCLGVAHLAVRLGDVPSVSGELPRGFAGARKQVCRCPAHANALHERAAPWILAVVSHILRPSHAAHGMSGDATRTRGRPGQ